MYNLYFIHNFEVLYATYFLHWRVISLKCILLPSREELVLYVRLSYLALRLGYFRWYWSVIYRIYIPSGHFFMSFISNIFYFISRLLCSLFITIIRESFKHICFSIFFTLELFYLWQNSLHIHHNITMLQILNILISKIYISVTNP